MKQLYIVKLSSKRLSEKNIFNYDHSEYLEDLKFFKVKNWRDFNPKSHNAKIFDSIQKAEKFISDWNATLDAFERGDFKRDVLAPCLIYKRQYLVLSALRLKNVTIRSYKKNWKPGKIINLYDQTYYLPVKILKITQTQFGYEYHFERI